MNWHLLKQLLLQLMLLYFECALSSLEELTSEVLLFLFPAPLHAFSSFLRDVEELVHGFRVLLGFPNSCLVHCLNMPDQFSRIYVLSSRVTDISSRLFPFNIVVKDWDAISCYS